MRTITSHLRANTHHKNLSGDLLKLDDARMQRESEKRNKSNEMKDIYNDINKLNNANLFRYVF